MTLEINGMAPLIQVYDMPTAIRFYRDVLGFEVISQSTPGDHFDWALLQLCDIELMLNTAYEADHRPEQPDPTRVRWHDDTALFFGCPDVDAVYQHMLDHGIQLNPPITTGYGMKQLYLHDPDGYNLCFQHPV